ncbi:MAG: hypothetical protein QXG67_03560 [Candidatus Nitrosotenuis sp.]
MADNNQWSNTAKELWQKLSSVKLNNPFKIRKGKSQAPQYWTAGTEKKIKEFLGWDLE